MYNINYHTGAGHESGFATIEEAQSAADQGAGYTQQDISIHDEEGNEMSRRRWWGVEYDAECDVDTQSPIQFGNCGYYGDWT